MARARFQPWRFSKLANEVGWPVLWYRALKCPCFNPSSGGAQADCGACGGTGYQYASGVEGKFNMRADEKQRYTDGGERSEGSLIVSIPADAWDTTVRPHALKPNPIYDIGENDLVLLTTSETRQHDLLTRGVNEKLRYRLVVSIIEVAAVVEDARTVYPASDYSVDADGRISWAEDAGPDAGAQYTVLYMARPEYIVRRELGAARLHGGLKLPKRFQLDLRDKAKMEA